MKTHIWITALVTGAGLACLIGCGGGSSSPAPAPQTPAAITVAISASSTALGTGQSSQLTATVGNDSKNAGVTWSLASGAPGTLTTVDTLHATYAAGTVTQNGSAVITATSVSDPSKTASVTIQLSLILTVNVTPASNDIGSNQTLNLLASIANDPSNAGVTWTLASGAAGTLTTVDTTHASYQSPASISQAGSVTVTATSKTDGKTTGTAAINLHPITVAVANPTVSAVSALQTSQLAATVGYDPLGVTWTASSGTIVSLDSGCASGTSCCPQGACAAIYSAPENVAAAATATITATSVSDPTKTASGTVALTAGATWENLVAYYNGLNQQAVKPYAQLETSPGSGVYQADRIIFHEVFQDANGNPLNTEIWRLDDDSPPASTVAGDKPPNWSVPGTLNRTPWNENGSYFDLAGTPGITETSCTKGETSGTGCQGQNYLFDAADSAMTLVHPTDPKRTGSHASQLALSSGGYLPWDRVNPNIFYVVTSGDTDAYAEAASAVFSVDISNKFDMAMIANLDGLGPNPTDTDLVTNKVIAKHIQSYLSEDDVAMVDDVNAPAPPTGTTSPGADGTGGDYVPNIYMVDLNPGHATFGQVIHQFPINFAGLAALAGGAECSAPPTPFNCTSPFAAADQYHFHDIYFQRDNADHFIFNYGPAGDVGEGLFWQASEDGSQVALAYPNEVTPLSGTPYQGHPALNFNGTLAAYAGYDSIPDELIDSSVGNGNWAWQISGTGYAAGSAVKSLGAIKVGHEGWDGYDPSYIVFDGYTSTADSAGNADWSEISADSNPADPVSTRILVHDGQRNTQAVAAGTEVSIDIGPVQSPDATKMMFSLPNDLQANPETDTNASVNSTYMAVDHRPFPPVLVSASGSSPVTLAWTAYLTHREVVGYHVYRSTDGKAFSEVASAAVNTGPFASIPAATICTADGSSCTFQDASAVAGTAYYYAVTAQEYSGLESSQLSDVMQVGTASATAPQGTTGWDTAAPDPPTGLTVTNLAKGEWKLTWTASDSPDVRYYNIYYDGGNALPAISSVLDAQHYLIASPAASVTSYIYFQANPNDVPVFAIVAFDRQDNPSTKPACIYTSNSSAACPQ